MANLNNLLNRRNNVMESRVENLSVEATRLSNKVLNKVYDASCSLKELLNITDTVIDMNQCENPIQVLHKIYLAGSAVGLVTVRVSNIYTLDVDDEAAFEEFKKSVVMLKDEGEHVPYESIWKQGINVFDGFDFKTGEHYRYYQVTNEEFRMFAKRISMMTKDGLTKEDAKKVQADLPPLARAWQEQSIDVSKDKNKVFDYTVDQFFKQAKAKSHMYKGMREEIRFGFNEIKKAKAASKEVPKFEFNCPAQNGPADLLGHANEAIADGVVESLNEEMHEIYVKSNNDIFKPFADYARENKELAFFIKTIFNICQASINEGVEVTDDKYKTMRNAIYSKALELGIEKEDVVKIAISTKMSRVRKDKNTNEIIVNDANIDKYRNYPVANIFPNELVEVLTDMPNHEIIPANNETILSMTRDIEDNEAIVFVNGVSEDGCIELVDSEFNGTLIESNGSFIHLVDAYEYEYTNALLITETTFKENVTKAEIVAFSKDRENTEALDNGEFLNKLQQDLRLVQITGKNKNLLTTTTGQYIGVFEAIRPFSEASIMNVTDIVSYKPANGYQQMFLITVQ